MVNRQDINSRFLNQYDNIIYWIDRIELWFVFLYFFTQFSLFYIIYNIYNVHWTYSVACHLRSKVIERHRTYYLGNGICRSPRGPKCNVRSVQESSFRYDVSDGGGACASVLSETRNTANAAHDGIYYCKMSNTEYYIITLFKR